MIVCTFLTVQQSRTHLLLENVNFYTDMHSQTMYYARFLLYNLD